MTHVDLLADAEAALERAGCQFEFCNGPTLEPEDTRTCYRCDVLARLRVALGRPPRLATDETVDERNERHIAEFTARATSRHR